jgi:transposase InsO family protein
MAVRPAHAARHPRARRDGLRLLRLATPGTVGSSDPSRVADDQILQVHAASRGTYGARPVHAGLALGRGLVVSHGTVELLVARAGIRGMTGRPRWRRPTPDMISTDLVERTSTRSRPHQLWVTDITEHRPLRRPLLGRQSPTTYFRNVFQWNARVCRANEVHLDGRSWGCSR